MKTAILASVFLTGALQSTLNAQDTEPDPVPPEENAEPESFDEAIELAHAQYITNLEQALELAIAEGLLDEAVHVRRMIAMEKLRAELTGTNWTRNVPNKPATLQFHSARRATHNNEIEGVWDVIEDRVVLIKFSDAVIMHRFNEDTTSYSVRAFGPIETRFTTGRRIGGD